MGIKLLFDRYLPVILSLLFNMSSYEPDTLGNAITAYSTDDIPGADKQLIRTRFRTDNTSFYSENKDYQAGETMAPKNMNLSLDYSSSSGSMLNIVADSDIDCAGECFGDALVDECGTCDDDSLNDCVQDCAGVWGGDAIEDDCGVCNGSNDCLDCAGVPNGQATCLLYTSDAADE